MDILKNGVLMAIIAHGLIGLSLVWDKVLLKKPETKNLVSYVFWMGALSVLALCLIPFGFRMPEIWIAGLAFGTGVLHLVAVFFYYAALKLGEASQTLAIMGGFSPVMTALLGLALLPNMLGAANWLAFALLTLGGFLMFFSERLPLRKILPRILIASVAFAFVNVLDKMVFNHTNFVTGYVFFTLGTFIGALGLLTRRSWRRQIFQSSERSTPRSRFWYFVNRFASGIGSFLTFYAISLTNPALVDAITGLRYVIIFLGALALTYLKPDWLRENFRGRAVVGKAVATALVVAGLVLVGLHSEGKGAGSPAGRLFRFHPVRNEGSLTPFCGLGKSADLHATAAPATIPFR